MPIFSRKPKPQAPVTPARAGAAAISPSPTSGRREDRIRAIGAEFLDLARRNKAGFLSRQFWSDKLMDWSMKDHDFKVQLFRFVDAFPTLRTPGIVHDHLVDYLTQPGVTLPPGLGMGVKAGGAAKSLMTSTISGQIRGMGQKFIAGTDAADALPGLEKLWKAGVAFSVDLLGEACLSHDEADMYRDKYLDLVTTLPAAVASWKPSPRLEHDHLGPIPRTNVSIKISSLSPYTDPIDIDGAIRDLLTRLTPILEAAAANDVFINFDMEQEDLRELTLRLFFRCCEAFDFQAGLALQAYLKSCDADAARIIEWSKRTGRIITVRLVKGAYWDYETIHAEEMGWPCPVWNTKRETDACFERVAEAFIASTPRAPGESGVKLALGSHNVRSIAVALDALERADLPRDAIELQMLHGMADQLKTAAAEMGLRIREYVPVGEMIPGMAYLVRRLLENTSNESWLKAGFLDDADTDALLASPHSPPEGADRKPDLVTLAPERHTLSLAPGGVGDGRPFVNEPLRDFADPDQHRAFGEAIARAVVPPVANDGTPDDARAAVAAAHDAFPMWRDLDPRRRAAALTRAADAMRQRRDELSGIIIRENGKCWRDADADVAEAIDFCEYYARMAIHLFEPERIGRFIGELDQTWYQPRGVAVIISPWNFPLAIACGMTTAALVAGNTAILKPAEQTPGIASILAGILHEALASDDVLGSRERARAVFHFLPAPGETTGAALVRDPRIAVIAFTGSKAVGLDIIQAAGITPEDQPLVKKVICEMGGKNAIIIDTSADLDEAVAGVRHSAFGFQGQKCSACSRVIIVDPDGPAGDHTRTFIDRFVNATRALVIGDPMRPGTDIGPVIDDDAASSIQRYIKTAKEEGATVELAMPPSPLEDAPAGAPTPADAPIPAGAPTPLPQGGAGGGSLPSNFIGPHIFSNVAPGHTIAREEIFGPVVAIMHAATFDEALDLANASPYKLTGGVFSRKPSHLERARRDFRVGNLYLNRGITGALVARQPFGGFGMSGVGSKAGGADYLLQFVEPRACCENTMRRGFAPEL